MIQDSGRYGETALKAMGLWDAIAGRLSVSASPKAELESLAAGHAAMAVAFDTDAVGAPGIAVVGEIPDGTHPPIVYPVALTAAANKGTGALLAYLRTPEAALAFRRSGYTFLRNPMKP